MLCCVALILPFKLVFYFSENHLSFFFFLLQHLLSVSRPYCLPATSQQATAPRSCCQRRQVVRPLFSGAPALFVLRGRWSVSWSASIRPSTSEPCPPSQSRGSSATTEIRKSFLIFVCLFSFIIILNT